jgi:hypothetical protein
LEGRWREKWEPDLLDPALQLSGLRALLDHAGATLLILGLKIRRKTRRDERTGPIWDRQRFNRSSSVSSSCFKNATCSSKGMARY